MIVVKNESQEKIAFSLIGLTALFFFCIIWYLYHTQQFIDKETRVSQKIEVPSGYSLYPGMLEVDRNKLTTTTEDFLSYIKNNPTGNATLFRQSGTTDLYLGYLGDRRATFEVFHIKKFPCFAQERKLAEFFLESDRAPCFYDFKKEETVSRHQMYESFIRGNFFSWVITLLLIVLWVFSLFSVKIKP